MSAIRKWDELGEKTLFRINSSALSLNYYMNCALRIKKKKVYSVLQVWFAVVRYCSFIFICSYQNVLNKYFLSLSSSSHSDFGFGAERWGCRADGWGYSGGPAAGSGRLPLEGPGSSRCAGGSGAVPSRLPALRTGAVPAARCGHGNRSALRVETGGLRYQPWLWSIWLPSEE